MDGRMDRWILMVQTVDELLASGYLDDRVILLDLKQEDFSRFI